MYDYTTGEALSKINGASGIFDLGVSERKDKLFALRARY